MNTARRIQDVTRSHIDSLLDSWEKPQRTVRLALLKLEDAAASLEYTLTARKEALHEARIEALSLERTLQRWQERASLAVERGEDNLAREAIREKQNISRQLENCVEHIRQLEQQLAEGTARLQELRSNIRTIRHRERMLIERGIHAVHKRSANELLRRIETSSVHRRFDEFEELIRSLEERSGYDESTRHTAAREDLFRRMETEADTEAELQTIKDRCRSTT